MIIVTLIVNIVDFMENKYGQVTSLIGSVDEKGG